MSNVRKEIGALATFTAVVQNVHGDVLTGATVAFTSDLETLTTVDGLTATLVGATEETVTVTGTSGTAVGTAAVDIVDNTPATVTITVS